MSWIALFRGDPETWPLVPRGYQQRVTFGLRKTKHYKQGEHIPKGTWWAASTHGKARKVGPVPLSAPVKRNHHRRRR